ncbi:MAG: SDR family oxidoreductase, partial [Haloarcula sp.]
RRYRCRRVPVNRYNNHYEWSDGPRDRGGRGNGRAIALELAELGADIIVNNAGVGGAGSIVTAEKDALREEFHRNLQVHLWGAINCTLETVDGMVETGYGNVINITSIHTKSGVGMSPQYDVGKFSLLGLTKSLALELGQVGVRVNAVAPGWTNTRMTAETDPETRERSPSRNPLGRYAEPEEIASAVAFLASPAADYVNGHELRVDGGQGPLDSWDSHE